MNTRISIDVVLTDGPLFYHLLAIKERGGEVICSPPHSGLHTTLHGSGESHIRHENIRAESFKELPIALGLGEAGTPCGSGFKVESLNDTGCAVCICYYIASFEDILPYRELAKSACRYKSCFLIDKALLSGPADNILIQVWAVPSRNTTSYEFNNRNRPRQILYKAGQYEPQIWISGEPF